MKKIDFRKIKVKDIEGKETIMDLSKNIGNSIFNNTPDIGEYEFSKDIYLNGEVEITEERAAIVRKYMEVGVNINGEKFPYLAYVKVAVNEALDMALSTEVIEKLDTEAVPAKKE
ncbi:hypothetical protein [Bacteroides heparinolyticus]|uniref:hypothetical protein n=1 Tax=Prevotella heparinolytica TaxID=28113 RepID=UPI0023F3D333|nr:hypothetical protein [Bacteroides heparinolyticus]